MLMTITSYQSQVPKHQRPKFFHFVLADRNTRMAIIVAVPFRNAGPSPLDVQLFTCHRYAKKRTTRRHSFRRIQNYSSWHILAADIYYLPIAHLAKKYNSSPSGIP
mmetsp:Transcript_21218/g.50446  ORF Transcript_21218/g.50446 Transcript_21218/m.50446 type:complete len:106 (+) Transcript_21218:118-435(+)